MITQALQSTLSAVITSYARMAPENTAVPFAVHTVNPTPLYTKQGITGYTCEVRIIIVASTLSQMYEKTNLVKTEIEGMKRQTINNTKIEEVFFEYEDPDYDENANLHINQLTYTIDTSNP